jgi:hypothetical protein
MQTGSETGNGGETAAATDRHARLEAAGSSRVMRRKGSSSSSGQALVVYQLALLMAKQ